MNNELNRSENVLSLENSEAEIVHRDEVPRDVLIDFISASSVRNFPTSSRRA